MTFIFVLVVLIAGVKIYSNWKKKVTLPKSQNNNWNQRNHSTYNYSTTETYYDSYCWSCNNEIDSRINSKCTKCKKYFQCNNCYQCLCDKTKISSQKNNYEKKWQLKNVYPSNNKSYTQSTSEKTKKYYSKSYYSNSKGYCLRCKKKLKGDTSKPLCYECWKN